MFIFFLLVAVPIIEIALFIEVGGWLGLPVTIGIVILTAAIGTALLRFQGLATLGELQRRLAAGEDPSATLAHGAMILVAGVLLLTPGFFTDAVGLLLLTPPVRAVVIRFARDRITMVSAGGGGGGFGHRTARPDVGPATVEGEYEEIDPAGPAPERAAARGDSGRTRVPDKKPGP
jgi:UPF0716 protein FxsA